MMEYPDEREEIIRKLRTIAKERGIFTVIDCIFRFGLGKHHTKDWDKCAGGLIAEGELGMVGDTYQLIKEEDMETGVKVGYKGFRVVDGELKSLVVWDRHNPHGVEYCPDILTYKEGSITYAPEGSQGVFVEDTLKEAIGITEANGGKGYKVIHEVTPLGKRGEGWGDKTVYPAVLVGKLVEEMDKPEEPRPEPKFKVGDKVVAIKSSYIAGREFTITKALWGDMGHKHWHYYYAEVDAPVDEDYLELAPVEEWVDVTRELSSSIRHNHSGLGSVIDLSHEGRDIALLGGRNEIKLFSSVGNKEYKIEVNDSGYRTEWFKILKLVKS